MHLFNILDRLKDQRSLPLSFQCQMQSILSYPGRCQECCRNWPTDFLTQCFPGWVIRRLSVYTCVPHSEGNSIGGPLLLNTGIRNRQYASHYRLSFYPVQSIAFSIYSGYRRSHALTTYPIQFMFVLWIVICSLLWHLSVMLTCRYCHPIITLVSINAPCCAVISKKTEKWNCTICQTTDLYDG